MKILNKIWNYFNSPFSCKEEEIACANFLVTKVQHAFMNGKMDNQIKLALSKKYEKRKRKM